MEKELDMLYFEAEVVVDDFNIITHLYRKL